VLLVTASLAARRAEKSKSPKVNRRSPAVPR